MIRSIDVVDAARCWIGTPFVYQGRQKGVGVDCVGVVVGVAESLGFAVQDQKGYSRTPSAILTRQLNEQAVRVSQQDMQPGDILHLSMGGDPQHVAIYTGTSIIHSYESVGKCVEHGLNSQWSRRIRGVYRFKELS